MPGEVVYVLGTPGSNTVKIGRTTDLAKRVAAIQRMSPVPLSVLWSTPGGSELEALLHRHFSDLRSHGEWFAFPADPVEQVRTAVATEPWKQARHARRHTPVPRSGIDFSGLETAIAERIAELQKISDPAERFHKVRAFRDEIAAVRGRAIAEQSAAFMELKESGMSWRKIGELCGISGARAEQIAKA